MKKLYQRLSELSKMLILSALVAVTLMLLALIPLFVFSQPGWLIGIALGSVIEIINIALLYKGSELATKRGKPVFFLLFYFVRMFLFVTGFVVTALLGFGFRYGGEVLLSPFTPFIHSIWGVLIGYTPLQMVVIFVMLIGKRNPLTISRNDNERKQ